MNEAVVGLRLAGEDDSGGSASDFFGTIRGPYAARVLPPATTMLLSRVVAVLYVCNGALVVGGGLLAPDVSNRVGVLAVGLVAVSLAAVAYIVQRRWFASLTRAWSAWVYFYLLGAILLITVGVHFVGPRYEATLGYFSVVPIFAFYVLPRQSAVLFVALNQVGIAVVLVTGSGYTGSPYVWILTTAFAVAVGAGLGGFMAQADRLVESERRARVALYDLNRTLEQRVAEQVEALDRLGRLRRFLSPQVAEVVLNARDESVLEPHRRQIAVFFCDLRGFTSFSGGAEPEEVVEALDAYYKVVGEVLRRHEATVGTFAGDGIMAYLNDPVACEDAAGKAVQMAMELRQPMTAFIEAWHRKGFSLGYGVGIAYGYATLGTVGFEGRSDYTALGSVVNLAARLCGEASNGQILIDSRTADGLGNRFRLVEREAVLKGFPSPVRACEVVGASH
jgi:class 3 adenylate cyclase